MEIYLLIFVLSVISCFIGFALECVRGNIEHLKNGRDPNAGAALFPNIPIVPCLYLLATWLMNRIILDSGFIVVIAYFCVASAIKAYQYKNLKHEFVQINAQKSRQHGA